MQTHFETTGQVQKHLSLIAVRELLIPIVAGQAEVDRLMTRACEKNREAKESYSEAENLLLHDLGLDALESSHELSYVRTFAEVARTGRYDAQYFQPRYQRALAMMSRSGQALGDIASLSKRYFRPVSGEPFNYIEIGHLDGNGHAEGEIVMGEDAPSRAQWIVRSGDVVTSTVRPIRRLSALIEPEQDGFVCSSGFAVLTPRLVAPELLTVYLRLPIVSEIMDLHTTATMYPAIATDVLLKIPITLPMGETEGEIVGKVRQARQARRYAKQLFAEAKNLVERIILGGR